MSGKCISRPRCDCGNVCKKNGLSKVDGRQLYNSYCRSCAKTKHGTRERAHKLSKGNECNECGFVEVHSCQLDVDHIDGNHKNDDPCNIQTLCSNCHRLKTWKERVAESKALK